MNVLMSEIGRRLIEFKRTWILVTIGNILFSVGLISLYRLMAAGGAEIAHSTMATVCWFTFLTAASGAATEIGRSRRDATIAYFIGRDVHRSLLKSATAKTVADMIVALPPALIPPLVISLALDGKLDVPSHVLGILGGAVAGLAIGPAFWSAALYVRSAQALAAIAAVLGFAWVAATGPHLGTSSFSGVLAATSPAALPYHLLSGGGALWIWISTWTLVFGLSLAVGRILAGFVQTGGDLIVDALH